MLNTRNTISQEIPDDLFIECKLTYFMGLLMNCYRTTSAVKTFCENRHEQFVTCYHIPRRPFNCTPGEMGILVALTMLLTTYAIYHTSDWIYWSKEELEKTNRDATISLCVLTRFGKDSLLGMNTCAHRGMTQWSKARVVCFKKCLPETSPIKTWSLVSRMMG